MHSGDFNLEDIWSAPQPNRILGPRDVHVWRIGLIQPQNLYEHCRLRLSREELERADRFHYARDRDRFVISHAAVRQIFSVYLRSTAEQLQFVQQRYGKPELAPASNPLGLTFNLSHSANLALLAVAIHTPLGIDVERIRDDFGDEEIADRFFSKSEAEKLRLLPANQRKGAFFQCWTRKEAYIKARGEGLSIPLESFDVTFAPEESPALLAVRGHPGEASRWSVHDLQPGEGYAAALVVEGKGHEPKFWTWNDASRLGSGMGNIKLEA